MKEFERKALLEKVDRESATVGASIPDRIEIQGEEVELQQFVFEVKRRETVPPGEQERVEQAKRNLRRERLERFQRLEDEEMSYEEGERLVETIVGIDRALNALESLGPTDIEGEAERQEKMDQQRWMNFLKQVLGQKKGGSGPGL